jgi:ubiquinone/menaquinone biosynthesis C-methylase UbiE
MANDIYSDDFWKERLQNAINNKLIYQTVFHTNQHEWNNINFRHFEYIKQHIPLDKDIKILDVACGYGRLSSWFDENENVEYVGIDLSKTLIDFAKTAFPNSNFICRDVKNTNFADKEFDWAIAISLKEMIVRECGQNEWDLMEKELRRIAKNIMLLEYTNGNGNEICTIL